jgi:hypothetical protein
MHPRVLALAFACVAVAASGQVLNPSDPDWKEAEAPKPPAVRTTGLIPLDMPGSSLRFGVEPSSVSIGPDGVVRYVVVASSSTGAVNAMYEGVRCSSGQVKLYARHNPDSGWVQTPSSEWRSIHDNSNFRYSLQVARSGACMGNGPSSSVAQILRDLRSGADRRFEKY